MKMEMKNKSAYTDDANTAALFDRLLLVLSPSQILAFVEHCEIVSMHGFGEATIIWREYKPEKITHLVSDKI